MKIWSNLLVVMSHILPFIIFPQTPKCKKYCTTFLDLCKCARNINSDSSEMIRQFKLKRKKPFSFWIQWLIIEAWIWQLFLWGETGDILNKVVRIEMLHCYNTCPRDKASLEAEWHKNNSRKEEELRASWLTDWWWIFIVIALSVQTSPHSGKCPDWAPGHGERRDSGRAWHLMMRAVTGTGQAGSSGPTLGGCSPQ